MKNIVFLCLILGLVACKSPSVDPALKAPQEPDRLASPEPTPQPEPNPTPSPAPSPNPAPAPSPTPMPVPAPTPMPLPPPDVTAPEVVFERSPSGISGNRDYTIEFTVDDSESGVAEVLCFYNGSEYSPCESPVNLRNLGDGQKEFRLSAVDRAGNRSEELVAEWTVDLGPPSVELVQTPPSSTTSSVGNFEFTVSNDRSGIRSVNCSLDGLPYEACSNSIRYENLSVGTHQFRIYAVDNSGNQSTPVVYSWQIRQPPGRHYNLGEGVFPDLAYYNGQLVVAYQAGNFVKVQYVASGQVILMYAHNPTLTFPRISVWNNELHLVFRDSIGDAATYMNLTRGQTVVLGFSPGNEMVATENGYIAWQDANHQVQRRSLDTGVTVVAESYRPTGISRILPDGTVRMVDDDRVLIAGYTRPCWAGPMAAVEGIDYGAVVFMNGQIQHHFWEGMLAYTPRCAHNGQGTFAVATWGGDVRAGGGVRIVEFP